MSHHCTDELVESIRQHWHWFRPRFPLLPVGQTFLALLRHAVAISRLPIGFLWNLAANNPTDDGGQIGIVNLEWISIDWQRAVFAVELRRWIWVAAIGNDKTRAPDIEREGLTIGVIVEEIGVVTEITTDNLSADAAIQDLMRVIVVRPGGLRISG